LDQLDKCDLQLQDQANHRDFKNKKIKNKKKKQRDVVSKKKKNDTE